MSATVTFPISVDDFAAHQEKLYGEPIPYNMRKAMAAWVPVFNESFQDGMENDLDALEHGVERMNHIIEQHSANPTLVKFLETAKNWIVYAWVRGRAAA